MKITEPTTYEDEDGQLRTYRPLTDEQKKRLTLILKIQRIEHGS